MREIGEKKEVRRKREGERERERENYSRISTG